MNDLLSNIIRIKINGKTVYEKDFSIQNDKNDNTSIANFLNYYTKKDVG